MPEKRKKTKPGKKLMPVVLLVAVILMGAAIILTMPSKQMCAERWGCGEWSACSSGHQTRECSDSSRCGTFKLKPLTEQQCEVNKGAAKPASSCGDGKCAARETCSSCASDCGACTKTLTQVQNTLDTAASEVANAPAANAKIYTEPLGLEASEELMEQGYVIVRYYYAPNCDACREPVDIQAELTDLASQQSDLIALVSLNHISYPFDSKLYAGVQSVVYPPSIRIEGISGGTPGYDLLFGYSLVQKLQDGDLMNDIGPLICEHSDRCDFSGGRIVRKS